MYRDDGWTVHCLSSDARTGISPHIRVAKESTLLRLFRAIGATEDVLLKVTHSFPTGRGTVEIYVNETGLKLLRIRPQFAP
jgi:hypothetical protein